jgi:DNA-directed RNA polymerase subunit RPC12/RpoP
VKEPSEDMKARIRQARHNGGHVGTYSAILVITHEPRASTPHSDLPDITLPARRSAGYFLSAEPDLEFALEWCPIHTEDVGEIQGLPDERGVYYVRVACDFNFAEEWDFRIVELTLAMTLDIPTPLPGKPTGEGEPGLTHDDLRLLRSWLHDYMRITSIVVNDENDNIPRQQEMARVHREVDRLIPPECYLCGKLLVTGPEIKAQAHTECIRSMFTPREDRLDGLAVFGRKVFIDGEALDVGTPILLQSVSGSWVTLSDQEAIDDILSMAGVTSPESSVAQEEGGYVFDGSLIPGEEMGSGFYVTARCADCGKPFQLTKRDAIAGALETIYVCLHCGGELQIVRQGDGEAG